MKEARSELLSDINETIRDLRKQASNGNALAVGYLEKMIERRDQARKLTSINEIDDFRQTYGFDD